MVNPGAMVGPAVPILTLVDIDTVKAMAAVDEKKIRFIRLGQPATVSLEAYPGERFAAKVTNISPLANPVGRTIEVELAIPNPGHRIKPGMYAEAEWIESRGRLSSSRSRSTGPGRNRLPAEGVWRELSVDGGGRRRFRRDPQRLEGRR
jgi:hypothetical protein